MLSTYVRSMVRQAKPQHLTLLLKNSYATEANFNTKPFLLHLLDKGPSTSVKVTSKDALTYFKQMQTIRRIENQTAKMYKEKIIRGFCHLYSGQEACAVGILAAIRPEDSIITGYRVHGWAYLMGISLLELFAELAGRHSGCGRGKGGSMHVYCKNFYGGNGIVGSQVPLGAGVALAAKYRGTGGLCVALYGDGASNQGQLFETYNMAKLWSLPCIFVCENNGYGLGTSIERSSANTAYYTHGVYVPGIKVDGMDVLAMREATNYAVQHCTSGKGPILLEAVTYRYSGHSMSDPGTSYRSREEVQSVRNTRDPITSFREKIISAGLTTKEELEKIDALIKKDVDENANKARIDTEISLDELSYDIYAAPLESTIRGTIPWRRLEHKRLGPAYNFH